MKVLGYLTLSEAHEKSVIAQYTAYVDYLHHHKQLQISLICEGSGTMIIGNTVQKFSAGEVYIIGQDQPHLFKSSNPKQDVVQGLNIYFDYRTVFADFLSVPEMEQIKKFLERSDGGFQVPKNYLATTEELIKKIRNSSGLDRLLETIKLLKFFVSIPSWKPISAGLYNFSFGNTQRLNSIYKYTMEHYHEDISIDKIASVACMTPHAFCKYFKKYTLKTYLNFLNECRIAEACRRLLSEEHQNISTVAYATGFTNAISFNRVFKKSMKLTPSEYLNQFGLKENLRNTKTLNRSSK